MKLLLNDASVLLNLLAADCIPEIAGALDWQFTICPLVRDEIKMLRDPSTGEMVAVDITPLIESGMLQILELSGEDEQALYVEQSIVVDDGEAMSIAIAASRKLEKVEMKEPNSNNSMVINYNNFQPVGDKLYPFNGVINISYKTASGLVNTNIILEYSKAEVGDKELKFPFNIPRKYERR